MCQSNRGPQRFIVLDAISRGIGDIGKIARVTKISSKRDVEVILSDLLVQRLIQDPFL